MFWGTGSDNNNVADTVQRIGYNNTRAGQEIDDARQQVAGASDNAARTFKIIKQSEIIVEQNTGAIAECRELVRQCQDDNRRAERIL